MKQTLTHTPRFSCLNMFQAKISFLITDIEIIGFAKLVEVKAVSHLYISIFFRKYLFYICMTNIFFSYRSLLELDAPVVSVHVMQDRKKKNLYVQGVPG